MADQITDGRTLVDAADAATNYVDLTGLAAGTLDTDVKLVGTGSLGDIISNTRNGLLYNAGAAQNWSSNVFYLLINCGIVGLLDTKANGGFAGRFCGATVTDWFEVYLGGSDDWPPTFAGGWALFVIDIETARSTATANGWTNGTVPATSAIQYIGWSGITAGTMTKMVDNTWMDETRRLPDGSPGIVVEGRNGGTVDWSFADIVAQLGAGVPTFRNGPGGSFVLSTWLQIGIDDTTAHGFADSNKTILFDDQEFAPADLYKISALGNAGGTTNLTLGTKTGTGDAATGAQGCSFEAAAGGVRFDLDFNDPNLDSVGLYGCNFKHGGALLLDSAAISAIGCLYLDCTSALATGSEQLRNSVVNANTADGVAFMTANDLDDIAFCNFEFSDGHAIELVAPLVATQPSKGNKFAGYGADGSNDAALYSALVGSITVNVSDGGDSPTTREGAGTTITVNNPVNQTITGLPANSEITWTDTLDPPTELFHVEDVGAGGSATYPFNGADSGNAVIIVMIPPAGSGFAIDDFQTVLPAADQTIPVNLPEDPVYFNPA